MRLARNGARRSRAGRRSRPQESEANAKATRGEARREPKGSEARCRATDPAEPTEDDRFGRSPKHPRGRSAWMPSRRGLVFSKGTPPGGGRGRQRVEGTYRSDSRADPQKEGKSRERRSRAKAKDFFLPEGSCSGANQSRADRRRRESYDNRCNVVAVYAICYRCDGDGVNARLRFQHQTVRFGAVRCSPFAMGFGFANIFC